MQYLETLTNQAVELSLYCGQIYESSMRMTLSDSREFFSSKAFAGWKKGKEHETKLQLAVIERLDGVIKGLNNLAKAR